MSLFHEDIGLSFDTIMDETLPSFRYHPDPVATGNLKVDAGTPCLSCSRIRGYIYTGPVWLGCCSDAAAYLGMAGAKELRGTFQEAAASVKHVLREDFELSGADLKEFMDNLSTESDPTAYIFRCLHCKKYLSYVDQG